MPLASDNMIFLSKKNSVYPILSSAKSSVICLKKVDIPYRQGIEIPDERHYILFCLLIIDSLKVIGKTLLQVCQCK